MLQKDSVFSVLFHNKETGKHPVCYDILKYNCFKFLNQLRKIFFAIRESGASAPKFAKMLPKFQLNGSIEISGTTSSRKMAWHSYETLLITLWYGFI